MWICFSYGSSLNVALNMILLRNWQKWGTVIMVYTQDNLVPITLDFYFATLTKKCQKSCGSWPLWSLSNTVIGWIQVVAFLFVFFFHFQYDDELPSSCFLNSAFFNRDLHVGMLIALIKCFIVWPPLQNGRRAVAASARGTSHTREKILFR